MWRWGLPAHLPTYICPRLSSGQPATLCGLGPAADTSTATYVRITLSLLTTYHHTILPAGHAAKPVRIAWGAFGSSSRFLPFLIWSRRSNEYASCRWTRVTHRSRSQCMRACNNSIFEMPDATAQMKSYDCRARALTSLPGEC